MEKREQERIKMKCSECSNTSHLQYVLKTCPLVPLLSYAHTHLDCLYTQIYSPQ